MCSYHTQAFSLKVLFCSSSADAPSCKLGQRVIYGTAMKSSARIGCHVDANPLPHGFRWQFKSATPDEDGRDILDSGNVVDRVKNMVDLKDYAIHNDASVLTYRVADSKADYGQVYCWAENVVGTQHKACVFKVSLIRLHTKVSTLAKKTTHQPSETCSQHLFEFSIWPWLFNTWSRHVMINIYAINKS